MCEGHHNACVSAKCKMALCGKRRVQILLSYQLVSKYVKHEPVEPTYVSFTSMKQQPVVHILVLPAERGGRTAASRAGQHESRNFASAQVPFSSKIHIDESFHHERATAPKTKMRARSNFAATLRYNAMVFFASGWPVEGFVLSRTYSGSLHA